MGGGADADAKTDVEWRFVFVSCQIFLWWGTLALAMENMRKFPLATAACLHTPFPPAWRVGGENESVQREREGE